MIPARNATVTHAQIFLVKDELLLTIQKTSRQCTRSLHATRNASCFSPCPVIERTVTPISSSPVAPSIRQKYPTPRPTQPPSTPAVETVIFVFTAFNTYNLTSFTAWLLNSEDGASTFRRKFCPYQIAFRHFPEDGNRQAK